MTGSNFTISATACALRCTNGKTIQFDFSLDQKFSMNLMPIKIECGLTTALNITPVFKTSYSLMASTICKHNADFLICEKKRTEHLFYTACNGTTPKGVTDVNENRELTVAGKRYIDFVSGNTTYAANGAKVLEKAAPALSAVAMAAGGAVSGACGNIGVIGLASAVVSTLMPLTSYIAPVKNFFSKKDQRQNPLINEMENLDGRHDDFDIGSYTDGNMDLVYGSGFSAGSSKNSMKIDPVKSNISIESADSLHLVAGGKDLICVQNDSITVRTADDQSITITPKQITVKSGEFTAVVSPDAVKLGDNVTLKADSYTLFSLDVGSRKSFSN
jgi:hypothetical protein